jgi:surface protein
VEHKLHARDLVHVFQRFVIQWQFVHLGYEQCREYGSTFGACASFTADILNWNVGKVTIMKFLFFQATTFDGDVSSWDVSHVNDKNV